MAKGDVIGHGKETQFSSENQPSTESKKKGWQKKRLLKDLADILLQGNKLNEFKLLANDLGIDLTDDEMTLEVAMSLKQAEKAIEKGDTSAYNSVMDRLKGRPMQEIDHKNNGKSFNDINKVDVTFKDFSDEDNSE